MCYRLPFGIAKESEIENERGTVWPKNESTTEQKYQVAEKSAHAEEKFDI